MEAVVSSIAEGTVGRLGSEAVREIALLWGVNEELAGLEETISTIKAVLADAEKKQIHDDQVKTWLSRLEDVVYEADDLVDGVSTEALRRQVMTSKTNIPKQVRTFFSTSNQLVVRHKMSHKIESLKKKLAGIRDDRQFHLEAHQGEAQAVYNKAVRDTHSFVSQGEVVIGRDGDRMNILQLLLYTKSDHENVSVVNIVGHGGLGKTTLARLVFNDEKVEKHFDLKMWVCVSDADFDVGLLVQKIIKSISNNDNVENCEMELLQKSLREKISGKRYLLVLDDLWNENRELWLKLKDLLLNGIDGSRIIVTTRSMVVARITKTTLEPYLLGNLDDDESWSLFKKMAFTEGQEPNNSNIIQIGKEIVKKCKGIPLAIRTIGRMLYSKDRETEWLSFHKTEFSKISQDDSDILPTLKLSYDCLTSNLKHCFSYCSLFPKDHVIDVDDLINLWMAQGFIKLSDATQSLEDMGREYFMELYWRSFFQDVEEDKFGNIYCCKMHDLMHDLALNVAGAKCAMLPSDKKDIDRRARHLSFNFSLKSSQQIPTSLSQTPNRIRTVLLPGQQREGYALRESLQLCDAFFSNFKSLRALDLHGSGLTTLSNSIGKLRHLRYLDLSGTKIKALPNSITKLQNLQTLKLSRLGEFKEFPRDMKKLISLRHLEFDGVWDLRHMPSGLGQLTNLQTLSYFVLSKGTNLRHGCGDHVAELKELMPLNSLRNLCIINLRHGKTDGKAANLKAKQYLQSLRLYWSSSNDRKDLGGAIESTSTDEYEMTLESFQPVPNLKRLELRGYGGVRLSSWVPSLKQLVSFTLSNCIKCQTLPPLDQFPSLKELCLSNMPLIEYISDDFFTPSKAASLMPSLEILFLEGLSNLKGWWRDTVTDGTSESTTMPSSSMFLYFPRLSDSHIQGCPKLKFLPFSPSIAHLTLESSTWMPFHRTMMSITTEETSSSSSTPSSTHLMASSFSHLVSTLKDLWLCNIKDDLHSLPNWFKSLTSLESLSFDGCSKLKHLSPIIQHLVSLRNLGIMGCNELDMSSAEVISWKACTSLVCLSFMDLPRLETPPEGLQYFTTLRGLEFFKCKNLKAIPEWFSNLTSLIEFVLISCPSLTSLPEGLRSITSLQTLRILGCPILLRRCKREKGEDWPKIAHIPRLNLGAPDDSESPSFSDTLYITQLLGCHML
ncbi:putative disease resistance protein RGA4 [Ziziphus jujuba]|uniref:Disease resistance protein RGA4 n=1 Tax=Ziziphus jujuba TaxID=326968 RepID=A0ABM3ZVC3_ZIZJJ|nr:putative disease resistance protein RGA4 [Ziziphus jujuba]